MLQHVEKALLSDSPWRNYFSEPSAKIHLAILVEPYLTYMLDGRKTIESRFSVKRCAPFEQIGAGDIILLKKTAGPIVGICRALNAWFYSIEPESWESMQHFSAEICAEDPNFWESRRHASFATLIHVHDVESIDPIPVKKRDRRGWVVVREKTLF